MLARDFLQRLDKVKGKAPRWTARCPAHDDADPSLSVTETADKLLVKCHAGCQVEDVVGVLGLTVADLFIEPAHGNGRRLTREDADRALANRGLRPETIRHFRIKALPDKQAWRFPLGKDRPYKYKAFSAENGRSKYWTDAGATLGTYHLGPCYGTPTAWLVEGEPDVWTMSQAGLLAFSITGGAGNVNRSVAADIARAGIGTIRICYDNDDPGREGAQRVAAEIRRAVTHTGTSTHVEIRELPTVVGPCGDVTTYYNTLGRDDGAFRAALDALPVVAETAGVGIEPTGGAQVITLADVAPERITWLWPGRIACGKLTLLVGDPEAGKSTISIDVCARVTRGAPWPDGCGHAPVGDVLYLTLEDGLADTIRPRLDAAGADARRVHSITAVRDQAGERTLLLPADIATVERIIGERGVKFIVLDPVKGYMPGTLNEWRDGDVRRVLGPLAALGERTGVAILAIVHLTKGTGAAAQYRVSGSVAFTAAARSVLLAAPDPGEPDSGRRILAPLKSSNSRRPASLTYTIISADGSLDGPAVVQWGGESPVTARQALAAHGDDERTATDEAVEFLDDELAEEPRSAKEVQRRAREAGISDRALRRGRERRGVRARRVGFGRGGEWVWELPIGAPTPPESTIDAIGAHIPRVGIYGAPGAPMRDPGSGSANLVFLKPLVEDRLVGRKPTPDVLMEVASNPPPGVDPNVWWDATNAVGAERCERKDKSSP